MARAFNLAGADSHILVFKNRTPKDFEESLEAFKAEIEKSQIVVFAGGFCDILSRQEFCKQNSCGFSRFYPHPCGLFGVENNFLLSRRKRKIHRKRTGLQPVLHGRRKADHD
ncbi:hypothetical protein [Treponema berlinense]|uniref:hypothetical protein n=1 Tax=Treponema berlinense TaxID=225004 RepID=UPI0034E963AD